MRILAAMLGGTIASENVSGTIKLGRSSFVRSFLLENFPSDEFVFPSFETYSSENATPELYINALSRIVSETETSRYDGILISHGTDTCAFFAQLAARTLPNTKIPFVITGSMKSPDVDRDEPSGNLEFAVKMLSDGRSGVVFRDEAGEEQLYRAHLIMSPDINGIYAEYKDGIEPSLRALPAGEKLPKILTVPAFPGSVLPEEGFDRVLICCNHSGTASAELKGAVRGWVSRGIQVYMAPIPRDGGVYESRQILRDAGAVELCGMPVEGAWAEVLTR